MHPEMSSPSQLSSRCPYGNLAALDPLEFPWLGLLAIHRPLNDVMAYPRFLSSYIPRRTLL